MSAPDVWRVVDGLGGVREVPVRVEGQLLLVGPGPQPRYYGSEEPPRLALMHYALTMRWPLARILAPGEALDDDDAQRTRAEAAEAEVARLRAIVEGRTTAPTDAEIDANWRAGGGWIYSRPEGVRASVVVQPMTVRTIIYAAACQRETLRWMAVDANSRPTAWPVVEAPAPDLCECGHPVEMHRGADRCGAHGCGCDRDAEEASWR